MSSNLYNFLRPTVGKKIIFLFVALLFFAIAILTHLSSSMFKRDTQALVQQMTSDSARYLSESIHLEITNIAERSKTAGYFMLQNPQKEVHKVPEKNDALAVIKEEKNSAPSSREEYTAELYKSDDSLIGIFLFESNASGTAIYRDSLLFDSIKKSGEVEISNFASGILGLNGFKFENNLYNEVKVGTLKISDDKRVLVVATPFYKDEASGKSFTLATVFSQSAWVDRFSGASFVTNYMVDQTGAVLMHPDTSLVNLKRNLSSLEIVKKVMEGKLTNGQTIYWDEESKERKIGAFNLVGVDHLAIVSDVPESRAYESAERLEYRAFLIAFAILFFGCGLGYVFSKTLTWPLKRLLVATQKIAAGDFSIKIKEKGADELSQLSRAFNKMTEGLIERDRVKLIFGKFHNKEVADKILSGKVNLGGERKEAVIFFSDIRGFTEISEKLSPEEVVGFLNEYMTEMVSVIRFHGGIVDKYIGDAIMALWGVPLSSGDDIGKAVRACLEMRTRLAKFNEKREANGKHPIYIGMGLNSGEVVAGNIGSDEKMEYTVIGDSVNTASRIESMTKEFGTDLLVSKSIYEKIKDNFLMVPCEGVKVKGKSELLSLYKVLGYKNGAGETITVETKYSSYTASKSDKSESELPKVIAA